MLKIWDLSTRIYHWLQAILFFVLAGSAYGLLPAAMHQRAGIALLVLLIWRLGWGLFGSETSRFRQFVKSPNAVLRYMRGKQASGVGHNPVGALMVITLIVALLVQAATGLMMSELVDGKALLGRSGMRLLADIHSLNALLLIGLVSIHIVVILVYRLKGNNLIRAMITGRMKVTDSAVMSIKAPRMASQRRALVWLICSVTSVITLVKLLS